MEHPKPSTAVDQLVPSWFSKEHTIRAGKTTDINDAAPALVPSVQATIDQATIVLGTWAHVTFSAQARVVRYLPVRR